MKRSFNRTLKFIFILLFITILWSVMLVTDYWHTMHYFEKPIFAIMPGNAGADDGGSGTYTGIGYSIEIKGNFMTEDEFPGVTHAKFMLFGIEIDEALRD